MPCNLTRRHFFYGPLLAAAVPSSGFGSVASLKAAGFKPFSEKLNIAAVGVGGQGANNVARCGTTENIVALCDVDSERAAPMFNKFPNATRYKDFRVMLDKEDKNIDAVVVSVPDHMHAIVATACMQRGKHVYVEKPLAHTPWECRLLYDAAAKYKVATQMGNQGYSFENHRVASEILWSGEIGEVREVHVSTSTPIQAFWPQGLEKLPPEEAVPANLDWDLWLGGAPMRPYHGKLAPFNWRGYLEFGTGPLGDWGVHAMGPANMALQLTTPISVEVFKQEGKSQWTFPSRSVLRYDFPVRGNMPAVSIYWHDAATNDNPWLYRPPGMEKEMILPAMDNLAARGRPSVGVWGGRGAGPPVGPSGVQSDMARRTTPQPGVLMGNGAVFVGSKGYMATTRESVQLLPEERWTGYELPSMVLNRSPGHYADWIRACKGGDPACSNFGVAAPYAEWLTLGAIAYRVEGKLEYDPVQRRFTNRPEANRFLKPEYRKGWEPKL